VQFPQVDWEHCVPMILSMKPGSLVNTDGDLMCPSWLQKEGRLTNVDGCGHWQVFLRKSEDDQGRCWMSDQTRC